MSIPAVILGVGLGLLRSAQLLLVAVFLLFVLFVLLGMMARSLDRGGCGGMATGCCLFEMIESIVSALSEIGCALLGCGGAVVVLGAPVSVILWILFRHRA